MKLDRWVFYARGGVYMQLRDSLSSMTCYLSTSPAGYLSVASCTRAFLFWHTCMHAYNMHFASAVYVTHILSRRATHDYYTIHSCYRHVWCTYTCVCKHVACMRFCTGLSNSITPLPNVPESKIILYMYMYMYVCRTYVHVHLHLHALC